MFGFEDFGVKLGIGGRGILHDSYIGRLEGIISGIVNCGWAASYYYGGNSLPGCEVQGLGVQSTALGGEVFELIGALELCGGD